VTLWAGLVFYLRLSWVCHWCAVRNLENFDDEAPCVSLVETIVSIKVSSVHSDLDSLPYKAVHVSGYRP
jgi:uncharacterized protein YyaL (SSP411 family)